MIDQAKFIEKLQSLSPQQLASVQDFVDFLAYRHEIEQRQRAMSAEPVLPETEINRSI